MKFENYSVAALNFISRGLLQIKRSKILNKIKLKLFINYVGQKLFDILHFVMSLSPKGAISNDTLQEVDIKLPLGSGGTSVLRHVKYKEQLCVLKVTRPYSTNDDVIHNEFKILSTLSHPNIIRLVGKVLVANTETYEFGMLKTGICLEYMDRGDLFDVINSYISWQEKLLILKSITRGLRYLHELKVPVVHQDIKPENIFISLPSSVVSDTKQDDRHSLQKQDDHTQIDSASAIGTSSILQQRSLSKHDEYSCVKIGDFGVAVQVPKDQKVKCRAGVGTERYMPPEYLVGGFVTPKSDIYSLGGIIFCMLYHHEPWQDLSTKTHRSFVTRGVFPFSKRGIIKDTPKDLLDLCRKCFAFNPAERPTSEEVEIALNKIVL